MPHRSQNLKLNGIQDHCEICGLYAILMVYRIDEVVCEDCRQLLKDEWGLKHFEIRKHHDIHKDHDERPSTNPS